MPTDPNDPLANQNIKDRFYGSSDPVADKLLKRAASMPKLDPPSDRTVMTLYVGGLDGRVTDQDLRLVYPMSKDSIQIWYPAIQIFPQN